MDKFRVRDLLEICEELGISVGPTKRKRRKQQILKLLEAEEVSVEEADEAHEDILERIEQVLAEKLRELERKQSKHKHYLRMESLCVWRGAATEREQRIQCERELAVLNAEIEQLTDTINRKAVLARSGDGVFGKDSASLVTEPSHESVRYAVFVPLPDRPAELVEEGSQPCSSESVCSPLMSSKAWLLSEFTEFALFEELPMQQAVGAVTEPVAAQESGEPTVSADRDAPAVCDAARDRSGLIALGDREERLEPVVAQTSSELIGSADRDAPAVCVPARDRSGLIALGDREERLEPVVAQTSSESAASADREARANFVAAQRSSESAASTDRESGQPPAPSRRPPSLLVVPPACRPARPLSGRRCRPHPAYLVPAACRPWSHSPAGGCPSKPGRAPQTQEARVGGGGHHRCYHGVAYAGAPLQPPPPPAPPAVQPPPPQPRKRTVATWVHHAGPTDEPVLYSSTMRWKHQRRGEVGVAEEELPAAFRGRTLPAAPAHVGPTPMDGSVPEGQAPLIALGPPAPPPPPPPVPPPGLPAPGLPPAPVAAIVEARASSQAFAAAIRHARFGRGRTRRGRPRTRRTQRRINV
ncbi:uncharacterized protein LOC144160471 [Haemaphysalis longicornis]